MKVIIIDDEEPARKLISNYLSQFSEVEIVAECSNGFEGLKSIQELKPDLIFLDIQMPKITGFELLELLDEKPYVIFSTAYNEYAVKAFEHNAIDYLLKPYSRARFTEAFKKVSERLSNASGNGQKIVNFIEEVRPTHDQLERVVVKTGTKIHIIPIEKILYIESQDDYVMIYTEEGKFLKQNTMKYFEDNLRPSSFVRIHRSHIVAINEINKLELYDKDSYVVVLKNGAKLPVSKGGYSKLRQVLNF